MSLGLRRGLRRIVDALQLGLFDALEPAPQAVSPPSSSPSSPVDPPAAASIVDAPWRHREATREAVLDGRRVAFRLVRISRRSIGFVVDADGLTVRAARRVPLREIDDAVQEKRRWILARLVEQRERAARALASRVVWRDGVAIDHLGAKLVVVLDPAATVAGGAALAHEAPDARPRRLVVALPRDAAGERIEEAVQSWLKREARRVFAERTAHFAARLGVRVRRLSLSSAATRWGSASADGSVRLHWRLIEHPLATIDYVVAHELAHLREMNHSPKFWAIVESVVPDYRASRARLRAEGRAET
nr:SprT family zinc-dependent metalloprotease [Caldimonas sp.]